MNHPLMRDDESDRYAEWTCRPERAADAREASYRFLAALRPTPGTATAQDLVLVVSELVTNALRHAGAVTSLQLRADAHSLRIVVSDPSPVWPSDRTPDLTGQSGGFGWPLVQRLAQRVAVRPGAGGGKVVLAVLAR
ncbi:ATP-binding protein [Streptomyces hebeiensis]